MNRAPEGRSQRSLDQLKTQQKSMVFDVSDPCAGAPVSGIQVGFFIAAFASGRRAKPQE